MESNKKIDNDAAEWVARMDAVDWSEEDQSRFDAWIGISLQHRVAFLRLHAAWAQADRLRALGAGKPPGLVPAVGQWQNAHFMEAKSRIRPRWWRISAIAAVAASLVLMVALLVPLAKKDQSQYETAFGHLSSVPLSDGSMLTMSSNTHLQVMMSAEQRHIDLVRGEAFFSVTKDADRPFVVSMKDVRVVAVGTEFSVRNDGGSWRVAVSEGVVRIEGLRDQALLLRAGSVAMLREGKVAVADLGQREVDGLLSWRSGYLTFHETPLSEAVEEFNRFNSKKIVVMDPEIASIPVGGRFKWSNSGAFVRLVENGLSLRARDSGEQIILERR